MGVSRGPPVWVMTEVVSEQFVLGVVCKVVSSRVLFMGVKPATFINRRLRGI